jgi:hypothetical protein
MDNQNLPLELLRPIIEHLNDDLPSLLAVSLVSSALRVEGQRLLFRTVALSENVEAHIKFLSAVTSSTLLGHFVKEYHQVDLLDAEHKQEPLWGLTCHGLQAMVNLKVLLFRALHGRPSAQILKECTFRLEVLKWECRDDAEQLYGFFLTQPNLRILKVEWNGPELNTSGISPGLQVLHGNRGTMNAFFPRRGITSLKWSPDREESPLLNGSIHHLSQEFHHIQFFSFGGPFGRPWLNIVIPHFRALEVLELIGLNFHEVCSNPSLCLRFSLNTLSGASVAFRHPQATRIHPFQSNSPWLARFIVTQVARRLFSRIIYRLQTSPTY